MRDHFTANPSAKKIIMFSLEAAVEPDHSYTLFRQEDWLAWVTFSSIFCFLLLFDNFVINRNPQSMTMLRAVMYALFWIICACGFCGWVYFYYGAHEATMWMSGYMLEWLLSFDNLFVFHMIFTVYGTPDHLKHRPLYLGICGAVFFRLIFIFVGEFLMHALYFTHFIFGAFLIYTGFKTVSTDEDDDDPSQQPLVLWLQRKVRFVNVYDEGGAFFVRVPTNLPKGKLPSSETSILLAASGCKYSTVPLESHKDGELRATMLFLVVCCLEVSDLIFAVDSVSAIVAQVPDLFLAYTSAVFAMLGLRATFFIIDSLARLFSLLKYGVGAVLVFVGAKLIMAKFYHVPPSIVCAILVSALGLSMIASVIKDKLKPEPRGSFLTPLDRTFQSPVDPFLTPRAPDSPRALVNCGTPHISQHDRQPFQCLA